MLRHLRRGLLWSAERLQDPVNHPRASALSRRTFTRAMAVVAFGGLVRPPVPYVRASSFCTCGADGQCQAPCGPNHGPCGGRQEDWKPSGAGANCWCQMAQDDVPVHACDCACPGRYCICYTLNSHWCPRVGGGGRHPGGLK